MNEKPKSDYTKIIQFALTEGNSLFCPEVVH